MQYTKRSIIKSFINPLSLYVLSLAVLVIVYIPSLFHLPRGDHWNILLHTLGTNDLIGLIKKSYSYARQSLVAPGDVVLFRPAQSTLLAIEKYLFNSNSHWPQIISFLLHISIFILLNYLLFSWFKLLRKDKGEVQNDKNTIGFFLPIITSFFILNFSIVELAIWASLKGYLIFYVLVLCGLIFCTKLIAQPEKLNFKYLFYAWTLFLISAFIYEFGQFVCLIVGLFVGALLFRLGNRKGATITTLSFVLIFFIYRAINFLDYNSHINNINYMRELGVPTGENLYNYGNMIRSFFSAATAKNLLNILHYTIVTPFYPLNTYIHAAGKVYIVKTDLLKFSYLAIPSYVLMLLWFYFLASGITRGFKSNNIYFKFLFLLVSAIYFAYLSIAVLGRMNLRIDYAELAQYSYYSYMGFGFFTILSALAIYFNFQNVAHGNTLNKSLFYAFTSLIVLVTIMGTFTVSRINKNVFQYQTYLRHISNEIDDFIANAHTNNKPRLAFDIKNSDYTPTVPGAGLPMIYPFFYNYINSENPDFIFTVKDRRVHFYTQEEHRRLFGRNNYTKYIIRKVVSPYKIYENNNTYYGVPHWHLIFDPLVDKDSFIIKDKNIANIIKNIPAKVSELNNKIKAGVLKPPFDYGMYIINKDYKGLRITKHQYWYFAIPKEYGDLEIERIDRNLYKKWFSATTLDSLYSTINLHMKQSGS